MPRGILDKGVVSFTSQGRLLQELGLRLVASPEVALVELIKNAYDADSPDCDVSFADRGKTLVVADRGHGMALDDFRQKWMQIATGSKTTERVSPKYKRSLTGAKGIGRFAVRYLGDDLTLESTAYDATRKCLTTLSATFDWLELDKTTDLSKSCIPYELLTAAEDAHTGTTLRISKLRSTTNFATSKELRSSVLKIVSPIHALESGKFHRAAGGSSDPGFKVLLPGDEPTEDTNLANLALQHHWARLKIMLDGNQLVFTVSFPGRRRPQNLKVEANTSIKKGFFADIRFFPRRKGVFQSKEVDGRKAWTWVRDNSGVAVIDHGFRIKPYGFTDDDWLSLDLDGAHNERDWRSDIAKSEFPISTEIKPKPGENPALNLPHNAQLVGAVFIETNRRHKPNEHDDLTPAMDREGLLSNKGFADLKEYVRAGIEFLAHCDKQELNRREEAEAKAAAESAREDIQAAIESIQETDSLTSVDKARIVKQYRGLADRLEEQEDFAARSRQSLMTMSLLGVVAGFMTHESDAMLHEFNGAVDLIQRLSRKHGDLKPAAEDLAGRLETFRGFVNYTKSFIKKAGELDSAPFSAAGQVRYVINRFKSFADERQIAVLNEVGKDVIAPAVPVAAYSGVLLNLYTNALKAIMSVRASVHNPQVVFRAWNEADKHFIEVLDNGAGIPPEMRKRIWAPLYTTTSYPENPLGPGMGLGLTLVKQVLKELGGGITLLANPPAGFSTCFRVSLPLSE